MYNNVRQYNKGYSAALEAVKQQNLRVKGKIDEGVKAIDDCDIGGGIWDSTLGMCRPGANRDIIQRFM